MGGGAAMRAAGKVAGIAAVNSGIRGGLSSVSSPAEQSVRNAKRPVSAIISSSSAQQSKVQKEGFQGPAFEVSDDWEIAGFEESEELQLIEPLPRLVFGGPPSLEEAKAATSEVKDALEKVYLSSPGLETKSCIISDARASSAPTHAIKAFTLLNRSPQAQTIVASIATDPNVWDAVLKNGALQEYLLSQNTNTEFQDLGSPGMSSVSSDDASQAEKVENGPMDILESIKHTVAEMVNNVSTFVQQIFGYSLNKIFGYSPADNISAAADANARPSFIDKTMAASFMALAVMVIMVVVLKRG